MTVFPAYSLLQNSKSTTPIIQQISFKFQIYLFIRHINIDPLKIFSSWASSKLSTDNSFASLQTTIFFLLSFKALCRPAALESITNLYWEFFLIHHLYNYKDFLLFIADSSEVHRLNLIPIVLPLNTKMKPQRNPCAPLFIHKLLKGLRSSGRYRSFSIDNRNRMRWFSIHT